MKLKRISYMLYILLLLTLIILNIIRLVKCPRLYSNSTVKDYEEYDEYIVYDCYQTSLVRKYGWCVVVVEKFTSDYIDYVFEFKTTVPIHKGNKVILKFEETKNGDELVSIIGVNCKKLLIKEA